MPCVININTTEDLIVGACFEDGVHFLICRYCGKPSFQNINGMFMSSSFLGALHCFCKAVLKERCRHRHTHTDTKQSRKSCPLGNINTVPADDI